MSPLDVLRVVGRHAAGRFVPGEPRTVSLEHVGCAGARAPRGEGIREAVRLGERIL